MNSSRAMLLAASLFSATVFGSENTNPPAAQVPAAAKTGIIAAVTGAVSGVVGTVASYTLDPVAAWTFEPILTRLPVLKNNATFKLWTPAMSKALVVLSAAYLARLAYNKSQADTVEEENDPFEVEIVEEYN